MTLDLYTGALAPRYSDPHDVSNRIEIRNFEEILRVDPGHQIALERLAAGLEKSPSPTPSQLLRAASYVNRVLEDNPVGLRLVELASRIEQKRLRAASLTEVRRMETRVREAQAASDHVLARRLARTSTLERIRLLAEAGWPDAKERKEALNLWRQVVEGEILGVDLHLSRLDL